MLGTSFSVEANSSIPCQNAESKGNLFQKRKSPFSFAYSVDPAYTSIMETTQAERDEFTAEAMRAYPTLAPLEATLALALAEARDATQYLAPRVDRTAGFRQNREKA